MKRRFRNDIFATSEKKLNHPILKQQKGAAAVEFAFAMLALFVFFAIYIQFVQIFIAQERAAFAGFAASRIFAVKGTEPAIRAASAIDPDAAIEFTGNTVKMTRHVPIPAGLDRFLTHGQGRFTVIHHSPAFIEPAPEDDNPPPN